MKSVNQNTSVELTISSGEELQGHVVRLGRFEAIFDILGRPDAVRTSEVLPSCKITLDGRIVYHGPCTVAKLINEVESFTCEVHFAETGIHVDALPAATTGEFERFISGWVVPYQLSAEFKVAVADFEILMVQLRRWLNKIEVKLQAEHGRDAIAAENDFLQHIAPRIIGTMRSHAERFDELVAEINPHEREAHRDYVFRKWSPHILAAPFAHRTFHKPLGYAGDYEMMNMIQRNAPEGDSIFSRLMHLMLVRSWPSESVRNRACHLQETLVNETARVARQKRRARVLNVGCGSAWEIQNFMRGTALSSQAEFTLLDFNEETLTYAAQRLEGIRSEAARATAIGTRQTSVQQLLRRTLQQGSQLNEQYDFIYCAGLFDYLSDATCKSLVQLFARSVSSGGLVVVANMNDSRPFRIFIEWLLDWFLIYRDAARMKRWCPESHFRSNIIAEPTTVNLFLHVRAPE